MLAIREPAAVETTLPWRRVVGSCPLTSAHQHTMPHDEMPVTSEHPSWMGNLEYTVLPAPSPRPSRSFDHLDVGSGSFSDNLNANTGDFATSTPMAPELNPLIPDMSSGIVQSDEGVAQEPDVNARTVYSDPEQFRTSFGAVSDKRLNFSVPDSSDQSISTNKLPSSVENSSHTADNTQNVTRDTNKTMPDINIINDNSNAHNEAFACEPPGEIEEVGFRLPPPWSSTNLDEMDAPRLSRTNSSSVFVPHLPQVQSASDSLQNNCPDEDLSSCHLSESSAAAVSDDVDYKMPLPWRHQGGEKVRDPGPVLSPSASFEMDSLQPHPSSQSQRLSEVASHHSEPYLMHHHLIDLPQRGPPVEFEISSTLETLDIEDGQMDFMTRVQQWLMMNNPDDQEPVPDDHLMLEHHSSHSHSHKDTADHTTISINVTNHHNSQHTKL